MRVPVVALVLALCAASARPCSLVFQPLSKPSKAESVFTATIDSVSKGDGSSAIVRLVDIHPVSPSPSEDPVEVTVFRLGADCRKQSFSTPEFMTRFPVGSRVAIVAERSRVGILRRMRLEVVVGGNSTIDAADQPSSRFLTREAIASLERGLSLVDAERLLQSLILDTTGEVNLGALFERYMPDKEVRRSLFTACRTHWAKWNDVSRCEPPN